MDLPAQRPTSRPRTNGLVHPAAPAGGCGPGYSRVPGPLTHASPLHAALPHPQSTAGRYLDWPWALRIVEYKDRAASVYEAIAGARGLLKDALYEATGQELHEIVAGLLPGVLLFLAVLATTTALGAAAGAAVGALAFGVGAAPGAAVGATLGFEAGTALLDFLGLAFLAIYIGKSLVNAAEMAGHGVSLAWHGRDNPTTQARTIATASRTLAAAVAEVFRGVLQGIVAFLLAKGTAAAAARVPELVAKLRGSKLGAGFAEWVERNWSRLVDNPRLKEAPARKVDTVSRPAGGGEPAPNSTSGHAGQRSASAPPKKPPEPPPPKQEPAPPPTAEERLAARRAGNAQMRESGQISRDAAEVGVTDDQLSDMFAKKVPLGFKSEEQFQQFQSEFGTALKESGLDDAQVGMKGTSTTFYSENVWDPAKPLGYHWDSNPAQPADYDLNITSDKMLDKMAEADISPNPKTGAFKTRDLKAQFPALDDFSSKWTTELGRDVNFVGNVSPPARDPTEFILNTGL